VTVAVRRQGLPPTVGRRDVGFASFFTDGCATREVMTRHVAVRGTPADSDAAALRVSIIVGVA
jgi:hypothetical protein